MRSTTEIIADLNDLNVTPETLLPTISSLEKELYEYLKKEGISND